MPGLRPQLRGGGEDLVARELDDVHLLQSVDLPGIVSFLAERLPAANHALYAAVREILDENKAERHIRGGLATRKKYKGY